MIRADTHRFILSNIDDLISISNTDNASLLFYFLL